MRVWMGVLLIALTALAGCSPAPYIIVDRETASMLNSPDWNIRREPTLPREARRPMTP